MAEQSLNIGYFMKITIDMDNTIIDEHGSILRTGITQFLKNCSQDMN